MDMQAIREKWNASKPYVKGAVAGLILGPILSLWMGWVVTSGAVMHRVDAAVVSAQASICAARARAASEKEPSTLDWSARRKLAEKWAVMPGEKADTADYDVQSLCADKLAEPVKEVSAKKEAAS